ncbi:MAG TPA: DegT/DnrJ/EryC1/StrS family aminotransferase, partial [Gallicola sp.]|nr:DegT/DnrJ/EryC1/StrS family aminotransferase [Gallicola sp.]
IMAPGINSKMNEVQAAMGLLQLKSFDESIVKRKVVADTYRELLNDIKGISMLSEPEDTISNYAYFPIFVNEKEYGMSRDALYEKMKQNNIYGRRYFYPLISEFSMYKSLESSAQNNLPVAHKIANEVICLPIYSELDRENIDKIFKIIMQNER